MNTGLSLRMRLADCGYTPNTSDESRSLMAVIAKEASRLRQSTNIFLRDGHVASLLAMTRLKCSSVLQRAAWRSFELSRRQATGFIASNAKRLGVQLMFRADEDWIHCRRPASRRCSQDSVSEYLVGSVDKNQTNLRLG